MNLKNKCLEYFNLFSDKDLNAIVGMFDTKISLIDWNVKVEGLKNVESAIDDIFNSVEGITIVPKSFYQEGDTVCCQIDIFVDGDVIDVIDIITFNDGKIQNIKAYKC